MIPLLQTKTADSTYKKFLQVTPGPSPDFWVGPEDKATSFPGGNENETKAV